MATQNKRLLIITLSAASLLLIPVIAMNFTEEVAWSASDFVIAGALLLGTGLLIEMVLRLVKQTRYRVIACLAVLFAAFLIWAELAVGIFGTPFAGS